MAHHEILHTVRRVRRRLNMQRFLHRFAVALLGCLLLCVPVFVVDSLAAFDVPATLLLGCPLVAFLVGALLVLWRPISLHAAAHRLDESVGLMDRTVSALEFGGQPDSEPLTELQLQDTLTQLERVEIEEAMRTRFPREAAFALLVAVLAIAFAHIEFFGPSASSDPTDYSTEIAAETEPLLKQLELAREMAEETRDEELKEFVQEAEEKLAKLRDEALLPKEALARLTELSLMLQSKANLAKMARVEALMRGLGEQFLANPNLSDLGHALKTGEYEKAAQKLDQKAEKLATMNREKRQSMSEALKQGGQNLQGTELEALGSDLASAGDSLEGDDLEGTQRKLRKASRRLKDLDGAQCRSKVLSQLMGACEACKAGICAACDSQKIGQNQNNEKSNRPSNSAGMGTDDAPFGNPTSLDTALQLERITGVQGEGPSSSQTIASPADPTESTFSYREVFAKYQKLSEDALSQEHIPLGYRHYVKRYFEAIKPVEE